MWQMCLDGARAWRDQLLQNILIDGQRLDIPRYMCARLLTSWSLLKSDTSHRMHINAAAEWT